MWHLAKFANNAAYREYISSDEVWLPRIAYILNDHQEELDVKGNDANMAADDWSVKADGPNYLPLGGDKKRWIDFINMSKHFIELANNGTMYFRDIQDVALFNRLKKEGMSDEDASVGSWYRAVWDWNGSDTEGGRLVITTPKGTATFNESTSELKFVNFPNDYTAYGGIDTDSIDYSTVIESQTFIESQEWSEVIVDAEDKILYGQRTDGTIYNPDLSEDTIVVDNHPLPAQVVVDHIIVNRNAENSGESGS